jgi:hypothetical protein
MIIVFIDIFQIVAIAACAAIKLTDMRQLTAPIDSLQSCYRPVANNNFFFATDAQRIMFKNEIIV